MPAVVGIGGLGHVGDGDGFGHRDAAAEKKC
jgi:hypothetical protein